MSTILWPSTKGLVYFDMKIQALFALPLGILLHIMSWMFFTAHTCVQEINQHFVDLHCIKMDEGFHAKIKLSTIPTLTNLYHVQNKVPARKLKSMKAERTHLQHLLISKDAGYHVALKQILCHELSPVSFSLVDTSRALRPTNKAVLSKIIQSDTAVEKQIHSQISKHLLSLMDKLLLKWLINQQTPNVLEI